MLCNISWTPAATLNNPGVRIQLQPAISCNYLYHVIARIGKCFKEDDIIVRTVPYPIANAGKDSTICYGTSVQLQATGGSIYSWSPKIVFK